MNLSQSYLTSEKLYSNYHNVDVLTENGLTNSRNVVININKQQHCLEVKLRDQNDFSFNFTGIIDWMGFDKMKSDQHLEIGFEEFHLQFIDLLKQTSSKEMLLRLEQRSASCKMVFYEKSRIKSLIFLIVDLVLTDQKDIINEMAANLRQLKESNYTCQAQLQTVKDQLREKEISLNAALVKQHHLEKQFMQDIKFIENTFIQNAFKIEQHILIKVNNLNKRCEALIREVDTVKTENKCKENIYLQTMFQLEQFKRDNEKNYKMIDTLRVELDALECQKMQNEKIAVDLRQTIMRNDAEIKILNTQVNELTKDIQEATLIIAQKTKTHDEIAKDLVQANTMLVNFNKQYDNVSKEADYLRSVITKKDQVFEEQALRLKCINDEFGKYKREFNVEDLNNLKCELGKCHAKIGELEKINREAAKINGLLTKKLANGDLFDVRNMNWGQPK